MIWHSCVIRVTYKNDMTQILKYFENIKAMYKWLFYADFIIANNCSSGPPFLSFECSDNAKIVSLELSQTGLGR